MASGAVEELEKLCGIRGCIGKHKGLPILSSGYHILRCDAKPAAHRAWNCKVPGCGAQGGQQRH